MTLTAPDTLFEELLSELNPPSCECDHGDEVAGEWVPVPCGSPARWAVLHWCDDHDAEHLTLLCEGCLETWSETYVRIFRVTPL